MNYIPYGKQNINEDDIKAVVDVLKSEFITQGPKVPEFEEVLLRFCGASHAVAMNSATSALHVACLALGVGPGDIVWTSPITFVASANCALYCGASVDFVDIDPSTYNMSVVDLERRLELAKKEGKLPKVVIPVHLAGQSCQMEEIAKLGKKFNFSIIEDASHAIGGKYKGRPIGCCEYSDITVFSFHPVKIVTTAEGGAALTNNQVLAKKMARIRSHGITRDREEMSQDHGPWYYEQIELGFNYRMTELQAALGIQQMRRIEEFVSARHEIAKRYRDILLADSIELPIQLPECYSSYHLFIIKVDNRESLFNKMRELSIGVNVHYVPVYMHPFYAKLGYDKNLFPNANEYYRAAISLPMYPDLTLLQQQRVIESLIEGVK